MADYLVTTPHSHCFRRAIPTDLCSLVGLKELRYSLRTMRKHEAKKKARSLAVATNILFMTLRESTDMQSLPKEELQRIIRNYIQELLKEDEESRLSGNKYTATSLDGVAEGNHAWHGLVHDFMNDLRLEVATGKYDSTKRAAELALELSNVNLHGNSYDFKKLCYELAHAKMELYRIEMARDNFKASEARQMEKQLLAEYSPKPEHVTPLPTPSASPSISIGEAVEKHIETKIDRGDWSLGSIPDNKMRIKYFAQCIETKKLLNELTRDDIRYYMRILENAPRANKQSQKQYKGKSIEQLLGQEIPPEDRYSPKSIKNFCTCAVGFLNWCEREGYLEKANHLTSQLSLSKKAKASAPQTIKREYFSNKELHSLFHGSVYYNLDFKHPYQFWAPLMALFTGMRLGEICQLELTDICEENGIPYIDINETEEKHVKSEAGKRKTPIHPFLVQLGLLDFVELQRTRNETRLFSNLKRHKTTGKWGNNVTKWFTQYRRECAIGGMKGEKSSLVFHSFRHTAFTWAKHNGINRAIVQETLGHEESGKGKDVTAGYEGRFPLERCYNDFIKKFDFADSADLHYLLDMKKELFSKL